MNIILHYVNMNVHLDFFSFIAVVRAPGASFLLVAQCRRRGCSSSDGSAAAIFRIYFFLSLPSCRLLDRPCRCHPRRFSSKEKSRKETNRIRFNIKYNLQTLMEAMGVDSKQDKIIQKMDFGCYSPVYNPILNTPHLKLNYPVGWQSYLNPLLMIKTK